MAIPILFIGIAVATGATGIGCATKGGFDQNKAKGINKEADRKVEIAAHRLDSLRKQCGDALNSLGEEKIFILNNGIDRFLKTFSQIKNVDLKETEALSEVKKLHMDKKEFEDLAKLTSISLSMVKGSVTGVAGGAAMAFGAYTAAGTFAAASTGTAISSLSGAAASNATLAFFGGGSLASGGLGMAGGSAVLGGLVAGPALLTMGLIVSANARKNLHNAQANMAKAEEICAEYEAGSEQCIAIRRRSYMYYCLLSRLDSYLFPLQIKMEEIINTEGFDYAKYTLDSKKSIAAIVSLVSTIKAVLDIPILKEDGSLTSESEEFINNYENVDFS